MNFQQLRTPKHTQQYNKNQLNNKNNLNNLNDKNQPNNIINNLNNSNKNPYPQNSNIYAKSQKLIKQYKSYTQNHHHNNSFIFHKQLEDYQQQLNHHHNITPINQNNNTNTYHQHNNTNDNHQHNTNTSHHQTNRISSNNQNNNISSSNQQNNSNSSSFIISLYQHEDRKSYDSSQHKSIQQPINSRNSFDSEQQKNKRNLIYANQSFKQTPQDLNQSAIENNNQIFEMVFLTKNKNKKQINNQTDIKDKNNINNNSISTSTSSFSKNKNILNQLKNKSDQQEEQQYSNDDDSINHSLNTQPKIKIEDFQLGRKLGAGKFGEVFIARHKKSGFMCAIKRINKQNIDQKLLIQLIRQIKIQTFLNHPNIVKLYTFFCDKQFIYFILELCYSGQLYNFLKKKRKLSQPLTKNIVQQTLKSLDYMHQNQIIHRDLKPENIIFHNGLIKLCDFGWSISSKTMRQTFCGTPLYVSPELLKRKNYNNKIDVWSIGILTYELLFGRVPFDITTERDFIKIVEDEIKFSKATKISDAAKDFILICLKKDPRQRYTVPQLLEHIFIQSQQPVSMAEMF